MHLRSVILLFISLFFSPIFSAEEDNVLHVGMELTYPPFEMIDKEGAPAGISVDIAHALGAYLNKKITIENISFIGLIPALKTGKIDIILSSLSITKERENAIDFSIPYLKTGLCLLVGIKSQILNILDLDKKGYTVVVKQGTTGQMYAEKNIKEAHILILDKESSCVLEVVQGKADAFIYDQFSIYTNWQNNRSTTSALLYPFAIEYWAMGIGKNNASLKREIDHFIQFFLKSDEFEKLTDRYLKKEKEAFKKLKIPFYL